MTQPSEQGPLAWPVAAGAVAVLIAALIGAGLLLRRAEPAAPAAPPEPAAAPATPRPTPATLAEPALAPTPASASAPAPQENKDQEGKMDLVGSFTADQPTPTPDGWWNDQRPADNEALSDEVLLAYNQFWQVRAQALYDLDASSLSRVTAGSLLEAERRAIDQLRARNQAQLVDVEHNARLLHASPEEAAVEDQYVSRSMLLDAISKEPLEPPPSTTWTLAYRLRKLDGAWKVVDSVRLQYVQR